MTNRILDFSQEAARLSSRDEQLVIQLAGRSPQRIPFSDIAVLIASHPHVSYSQAVLASLLEHGGLFVACDARHAPCGMLLPLKAHSVQAERFRLQAAAPLPFKKRLWQQIVRAKLRAQGRALEQLHGDDFGLCAMAARVRSGDSGNLEALAAQRYWRRVFADASFRRNIDADDQNRHLNYGYALLRAMVARAIASAGLHPTFGLHHSNRYNAFALADDLMEPFRPIVDQRVARLTLEGGIDRPLAREQKSDLIGTLIERFRSQDESRSLFDWLSRVAASLVAAYQTGGKQIFLPEFETVPRKTVARAERAPVAATIPVRGRA